MPPADTYMAIPPPPLPEFYLPRDKRGAASSTSTTSDKGVAAEITIQRSVKPTKLNFQQPEGGDGVDERFEYRRSTVREVKIPPPPPPQDSDDVPPLAVHHVCRICLHPRSARYHREHPIPVDGVPPPPGICRRCRVAPVDEPKVITKIVEKHESNDVKLGAKCLVPDEDYFGNKEMRMKRASYILSQADWQELEPRQPQRSSKQEPTKRQEVIYRHVHVTVPPPPPPPAPAPPPLSPLEPPVIKSTAQCAIDVSSEKSTKQPEPFRRLVAEIDMREYREPKFDTVDASTSTKSKHASSSLHRPASVKTTQPKYTESEIRNFARDEVERYRQAERKIESHKDPYAHGRLVPLERVPVERRLEFERDVVEAKPWERQATSPRRDSASVMADSHRNGAHDHETVVVEWSHDSADRFQTVHAPEPPLSSSSSAASDKTRWLVESQSGKSLYRSEKKAKESYVVSQESMKSRNYALPRERDVVKVVERYKYPAEPQSITPVADHANDPRKTVEKSTAEKVPTKSSVRQEGAESSRHNNTLQTTESTRSATAVRQSSLPHTQDDKRAPVSVPSGRPRYTSSARGKPSGDQDSEYYYVKRTVQPADRPSGTKPSDDKGDGYYKETQAYLHRRKLPSNTTEVEYEVVGPLKNSKRQPSVTSSRVRFSNKVDVSPTPPGSDASSSKFRSFGSMKGQLDGQDGEKEAIAEKEHRGRSRSREAGRERGFYYERDTVRSREVGYIGIDRDRTPRPVQRQRRPSDSSEPSTIPSNVRRWARVQSESPSRERLRRETRKTTDDAAGPYTVEAKRSGSVEVQDGSTVSSDSERQQQSGRRRKF